jgi:hypothetical protein
VDEQPHAVEIEQDRAGQRHIKSMLAPCGVFAHRADRGFVFDVGCSGNTQNALGDFSRGVVRMNMNVNRLGPSLLARPLTCAPPSSTKTPSM